MKKQELISKFKTEFTNDFSKEIFDMTYAYGDESIDDRLYKVAETIASIEKDKEYWTEKFYEVLSEFKFVPGGRILSNAGIPIKGTTFINCFVSGFMGEDQDSMEGILSELRRQALILKSEGGYGFCVDPLRPRGAFIGGIGNESPGAVTMLEMWDTQSKVITEGSGKQSSRKEGKKKIRKGAQMVTMSCTHPDIEEFITAKQTPGKLTKCNMSVLITDAFIDAVKTHKQWDLIFPDYEKQPDKYKSEWDGDLNKWISSGGEVKVYKTYADANELWDLITKSTYNRNEPGVLFIDRINHFNNLYYDEIIKATNPCGEQILPVGGVCLLGSLNLTQFINSNSTDWDFEKLEKYIPTIIRFMDNINDITYVPLDIQKENLKNKRRIGLGVMGYGSALIMLKKRYGSVEANHMTEKLMDFIKNSAYKSSALLASEKGAFPLYNEEKYLAGNYIKTLSDETIELIKKHGVRNSHLMSVQPTGNTGVMSNNISGGLEPVFSFMYKRTFIIPYLPTGLIAPTKIDWSNMSYQGEGWNWIKEGDENQLITKYKNDTYKIDKNRGFLKEADVIDYGVKYLIDKGEWNEKSDYAVNTENLTIGDHISVMEVMAKRICSAMSKCMDSSTTMVEIDGKIYYFDELDYNAEEDSFKPIENSVMIRNHVSNLVKVNSVYNNGLQDTIKITFDDGSNICCTYNHHIYTENGWISASDIKLGVKICMKN